VTKVKTTCPCCNGLGYVEEEEFETHELTKIICEACNGKGYLYYTRWKGKEVK